MTAPAIFPLAGNLTGSNAIITINVLNIQAHLGSDVCPVTIL